MEIVNVLKARKIELEKYQNRVRAFGEKIETAGKLQAIKAALEKLEGGNSAEETADHLKELHAQTKKENAAERDVNTKAAYIGKMEEIDRIVARIETRI